MLGIKGTYNTAKVFTDNIEESAIEQIKLLCDQEFTAGSQIRMMPDVHSGAGCTIGTTMTITDKIVPNLVGVDIGCLDCDTEVLTRNGWIKVSDYATQDILVYDKDTKVARFESPIAYIRQRWNEFYHLRSRDGSLDQVVSDEHKILLYYDDTNGERKELIIQAKDLIEKYKCSNEPIKAFIPTTFDLDASGLLYSDEDIKVIAMINADSIRVYLDDDGRIEMHLKNESDIKHCEKLLQEAKVKYSKSIHKDGMTNFYFIGKDIYFHKLSSLWNANKHQLKLLCDECLYWDGYIDSNNVNNHYVTHSKENADIIQFAFAANGIRYRLSGGFNSYELIIAQDPMVALPERIIDIKKILAVDGKKYCFTVSTGFFVIRRNNKISITGNCGMELVQLEEKEVDLDRLDKVIHKHIPYGFSIKNRPHDYSKEIDLNDLRCKDKINMKKALNSIGTLGGGNHFIELDKDEDGNLFLVIHSGSRHLGLEVANYYQNLAYQLMKDAIDQELSQMIAEVKANGDVTDLEEKIKEYRSNHPKSKIPKDLCYLEGEAFNDYVHDMDVMAKFADLNRRAIVHDIMVGMRWTEDDRFSTIHNYLDTEQMILRKGAVKATYRKMLLIPINMRDGSLICRGKGNPDWNYSAPHGAGRIMSRKKARELIKLDEFKESMEGIYSTTVNLKTIDESPAAYKPIDEIVRNIEPAVDVLKVIKPIYNFKAAD